MRLKRLKIEFVRKFFHMLGLPIVLAYTLLRFYYSEQVGLLFLTALLIALLELEYVRLEYKPKLPKFFEALTPAFRKREKDHVAGWIFFISAMIIVFATFDYKIALLAVMLTLFGDMASALVGMRFGKRKLFRKKTYVGFFAGLGMNLIVGFLILGDFPLLFIGMAVVASVVELMTNRLDDNITVPVSAGFAGQAIAFFLGCNLVQITNPLQEWIAWLI